jgi:hypothetical protein
MNPMIPSNIIPQLIHAIGAHKLPGTVQMIPSASSFFNISLILLIFTSSLSTTRPHTIGYDADAPLPPDTALYALGYHRHKAVPRARQATFHSFTPFLFFIWF